MYYLYLAGEFLALILPRSLCYLIASIIANLKFHFSKKDKEIVIFNLYPIVKDKRKSKTCAKNVFKNFAYYLVDFLRFSKIDKNFVEKYVSFEGVHFLKDLAERREKIIALTAHLGNYELGAALTSMLGYKVYAVALPHRDKRVNRFFNRQRNICGVEVTSTGIGVKGCFKALKEMKLVALVGDRDFSEGGREVKMFGRTCVVPRGASSISVKTGAYILPSFLIRENKKFYRLIFESPISPYEAEKKKTEDRILEECVAILEKYISNYPEQWYMFEKFWLD